MDISFILAAVIFTLLAIVVATSMFTGTSPSSDYGRRAEGAAESERSSPAKQNGHVPSSSWCPSPLRKLKKGKTEEFDWCQMSGSSHDHWDVVKNVLSTEGAAESPDHQEKVESNSNHSFKYLPGKSRSHHLQMMMSKEELEEEQRVQREQLAAIFQLLKNNQDTFGDVSQGDVEEQLKLYSI